MKKFIICSSVLISALLNSCSTDFEVAAPYKEIPVVLGLLNKDDSVQYVKINKAFLNREGSAIDAAAVADSNYFGYNLNVKLYAYNLANVAIDSVTLDTVSREKQDGIFKNNNLLYRTPAGYKLKYISATANDTVWAAYELVVRRASNGSVVTKGRTEIVRNFRFAENPGDLKLYNPLSALAYKYLTDELKWSVPKNGRFCQGFMRFKFDVVNDAEGTRESKYIDMEIFNNYNTGGLQTFSYSLGGERFYRFIADNLQELPSTYRREYKAPIEFYLTFVGEDMSKYIEITGGTEGLNDVRPDYTNMENGLGIFSSRMRKVFNNVVETNLSTQSIEHLKYGAITGHLNFR